MDSASTPAGTGRVCAQVGAHLEPVTRFGTADLIEVEPEQLLAVPLTLTADQHVSFAIDLRHGPGALPAGTQKLAGEAAVDQTLQAWLATARQQAPQALQRWAEADTGSYRRLLPGAAGFLTRPGAVGHEHRCTTCGGSCQVTCGSCHGQGQLRCHTCSGDGRVNCSYCHGRKRQNCINCGGRGQWNEYQTRQVWDASRNSWESVTDTLHRSCLTCSASGTTTCHHCEYDGKVSCSGCFGRGQNPCSTCRATGRVDCDACRASGIQHRSGTLVARAEREESLAVDTADAALRELVLQRVPLADLPALGALLRVRHQVTGAGVRSTHELRLDVRRGTLRAGQEAFVIHGFGPQTRIFSFENIASRLLADDLAALEQAVAAASGWRRQRGNGLLGHLGDFLRSELNLLLGERMGDAGSTPEQAAQAVERQFAGMVDADYVTRATQALRQAVAKVYASELMEPAAYLLGLVALAAVATCALGWPLASPWAAAGTALGGGVLAWFGLEWLTQRRIRRPFEGDYGRRLVAQLRANGSVRRWRVGMVTAGAAAALGAAHVVPWLPYVGDHQRQQRDVAAVQAQLAQWGRQATPDFRLRPYPPQPALLARAEAGDTRAQLVLAWRLLLGAGGVGKDVAAAGDWLERARPAASGDNLWRAAHAVQVLNQDALPDAIRAAAADLGRAADAGLVEARYWEARIYLMPGSPLHDPRRAQQALTQAAQLGHANAALLLGQRLASGDGLRRDPAAARRWLQQAGAAGLKP